MDGAAMPMTFIVNQMTGNSPARYCPAQPRARITNEVVEQAARLRTAGMTWIAIAQELGHSDTGLRVAVQKRGLL